jgi:hypothetical protein
MTPLGVGDLEGALAPGLLAQRHCARCDQAMAAQPGRQQPGQRSQGRPVGPVQPGTGDLATRRPVGAENCAIPHLSSDFLLPDWVTRTRSGPTQERQAIPRSGCRLLHPAGVSVPAPGLPAAAAGKAQPRLHHHHHPRGGRLTTGAALPAARGIIAARSPRQPDFPSAAHVTPRAIPRRHHRSGFAAARLAEPNFVSGIRKTPRPGVMYPGFCGPLPVRKCSARVGTC